MSIHTDDLRDIANNHGWSVCESAADEIDDLEKAYGLLFAENAKLRAVQDEMREVLLTVVDQLTFEVNNDGGCAEEMPSIQAAKAAIAKATVSFPTGQER